MRILVTGGAGFIGSNLVDQLVQKGHEVIVVDNLSTGKIENIHPRAKLYEMDIQNSKLHDIIYSEQVEIIYHLAAQISVQHSFDDPVVDAQINILGTVNLLEACRNTTVKKIIFSSSAAIYGEPKYLGIDEKHSTIPVSFYGLSKLVCEQYVQLFSKSYGLNYTILRYANVYGIKQDNKGEGGVISIFLQNLLNQQECTIFGDGEASRDYVYVEDIVSANLHSMEKGDKEIINIGTGIPVTLKDLYKVMSMLLNIQEQPVYKSERPGDIKQSYYITTKCQQIFQWAPQHSLEEGLRKTIEYLKKMKQNEV
jgi:UDP-glucose 4-epimerase